MRAYFEGAAGAGCRLSARLASILPRGGRRLAHEAGRGASPGWRDAVFLSRRFCRPRRLVWRKKHVPGPCFFVFPYGFPPLCRVRRVSLRQEMNSFQQRRKFLAAKKSRFGRRNALMMRFYRPSFNIWASNSRLLCFARVTDSAGFRSLCRFLGRIRAKVSAGVYRFFFLAFRYLRAWTA